MAKFKLLQDLTDASGQIVFAKGQQVYGFWSERNWEDDDVLDPFTEHLTCLMQFYPESLETAILEIYGIDFDRKVWLRTQWAFDKPFPVEVMLLEGDWEPDVNDDWKPADRSDLDMVLEWGGAA